MFKCSVCDNRIYSSQKALNKHDRQVHNIFKEVVLYECHFDECIETFPSERKLQEHHSKNHKTVRTQGSTFQCDECGKFYSSRTYLKIHANKHRSLSFHIEQNNNTYECYTCGSIFYTRNEICNHVKLHSRHRKLRGKLLCPFSDCKNSYNRYINLRRHISDDHNLHLTPETHEFSTKEKFNKWRSAKEQELKANYIMSTSTKKLKEGMRTYYYCHRSQDPRIIKTPKRNAKFMGTNKIGRACPSTMIVTYKKECLSVIFYPIHIGHCNELRRLRISETDRLIIAGKLSQGVSVHRVLSDIRESVPNEGMERIHLVKKKDINNIIRDFSIGYSTKRHKNDAVNVQLWVEAMNSLENNPVLSYKKTSEEDNEGKFAASMSKSKSNFTHDLISSAVPSNNNCNKNLLSSKLELIIGLNNRASLSEVNENAISKYLDKVIDIYNTNGPVNFEVKETVTTTKKIEPQVRMFSVKRKRKPQEDTQQPLSYETKIIKLALAHPEAKVPIISTDVNFDHSYSSKLLGSVQKTELS